MLYQRMMYDDYFWEMDTVFLFSFVQWLDFSFTTIFFPTSDICLVIVLFLQVGRFAYAGFPVWVADLLTSPGRSFDPGA